MVKKLSFLSLVLAALPLLLSLSCPGGGSALDQMHTDRVAYVGTVPFEPPLLYQKEGELVGPDAVLGEQIVQRVEETRESAGETAVRLNWISRTYPNLIPALKNREIHFILGMFAITEERKREVDFSDPYYTSELVLITNPATRLLEVSQIGSAKLGVREGTGVEVFLRAKYPSAELVPYEQLDDAVLALRSNEVHGVVDDRYMAAYSLATTPGANYMELADASLGTLEIAVAVRKGDQRLLDLVNGVIKKMKEGNQHAQLAEEHNAEEYLNEVNQRRIRREEEQRKAQKPRQVQVSVSKDRGVDIDIYRMANLTFVFRNNATADRITTSKINFRGRVGSASANVPPGKYTLTQPQFNFSHPVEVRPSDKDRISISIRITAGGIVVRQT